MRDKINRNNTVAEENFTHTGHPAKEKFGEWQDSVSDSLDTPTGKHKKDTPKQKAKKIKEMEEIIREDIERTKE